MMNVKGQVQLNNAKRHTVQCEPIGFTNLDSFLSPLCGGLLSILQLGRFFSHGYTQLIFASTTDQCHRSLPTPAVRVLKE